MHDTQQRTTMHDAQPQRTSMREAEQQQPEPANWLWVIFLAMFLGVFAVGPLVVYFGTRDAGQAALIEGLIALAAGLALAIVGARKTMAARRAFIAATPR
jgi:predicted lipid-binding transport protein (Tim44 family)